MTEYATLFEQGTTDADTRRPIEVSTEERDALRRALVDCLTALESSTPVPGNRIRAWRELAGTPYIDGLEPLERGMEGSARAAAKWTDDEVAQVDRAIRNVARSCRQAWNRAPVGTTDRQLNGLIDFTTADVWAELGDGFPITKGIAGCMRRAAAEGIIVSTGRTTYPEGTRSRVNHNQRLTVWRAL